MKSRTTYHLLQIQDSQNAWQTLWSCRTNAK